VHEILLDQVPNFVTGGSYNRFFQNFEEIARASNDPNTLFDPISEYLYNIMYPELIDMYSYVYASDFDQLIIPQHGQNMSQWMSELKRSTKIEDEATSVYLSQYWYLENAHSAQMMELIKNAVNNKSKKWQTGSFPIIIRASYPISLGSRAEINYARSLVSSYDFNMSTKAKLSTRCRVVYLSFDREFIYGQTVHATRSSEIVRLVGAGTKFPGGWTRHLATAHLAHYRDEFGFELISKNGRLEVTQFKLNENIARYCT
jgi:hypothetical protein